MLESGRRPFLHTKTRAVFSRFASVETILSALSSRNPTPVLETLHLDTSAPALANLSAEDAELLLHRHFILRLSNAIPVSSDVFPLFKALVTEYEIRNISLFLKHTDNTTDRWYPLADHCGIFGDTILSLSRETAQRLLDRSRYHKACLIWQTTHDTGRLDAALEDTYSQGLEDAISALPDPDRKKITLLYQQKLSLKLTLQALRMQRSYGSDIQQITSLLPFRNTKIRSEIISLLETPRFDHLADALPRQFRTMARNLLMRRPELLPRNPDPELGLSDLSSLEKLSANLMLIRYRHEFRVYGKGYLPLYCFYFLFKRELQNIMLLLNGIRFGIGPEILRSELVW